MCKLSRLVGFDSLAILRVGDDEEKGEEALKVGCRWKGTSSTVPLPKFESALGGFPSMLRRAVCQDLRLGNLLPL